MVIIYRISPTNLTLQSIPMNKDITYHQLTNFCYAHFSAINLQFYPCEIYTPFQASELQYYTILVATYADTCAYNCLVRH